MMNENYNTPNSGCCGRHFPTAPENKCKYNDCCMNEYAYKQKACIRNKQPDCEAQAVIPSITVETVDGITNLANCLVHVTSTNTTYYIDDKHRIMITWAGPVNIPGYDMEHNPNHYKNQIVTDTENETAVIYDNHGNGFLFGITEGNLEKAVSDKINEMAEDGELTELIMDYVNKKAEIIFPTYAIDGTDTLGDCSIIKTPNNAIMIDTFLNDADLFAGIMSALSDNGIGKLDYFIISHFDGDHYGNYQRVIDAGLINGARVILPRPVVNQYINKTGQDMKDALDAAGIAWEYADNITIDIEEGISLRFFNASAEDHDYYDELGETNYNNYSVCTELNVNGRKALFTGDCLETACNYIARKYILQGGYDLVKDTHHGFSGYSVDYARKACPKNVLIPASAGMIKQNLGYRGAMRAGWGMCTPSIYFQGCQKSFVKFDLNSNGAVIASDSYSTQEPSTDGVLYYHLDSTTTKRARTGSVENPFKTLAEANVFMPKNTTMKVSLTVHNLGSENVRVNFSGYTCLSISFNGNAPANDLYFYNISVLSLSDVNLESTHMEIIDCNDVSINTINMSAPIEQQLAIYRSKVIFGGSISSENAVECALRLNYSEVCFANTSLTYIAPNADARLMLIWACNVTFNKNTLALFTQYPLMTSLVRSTDVKQSNIDYLEELCTLFSSTSNVQSGTLRESLDGYSGFKVEVDSDGYDIVLETRKKSSGSINDILVNGLYPSGTLANIYGVLGRIRVNGTSVAVDREIFVDLTTSGNTITPSPEKLFIRKVIGIL